MREIKFRGRDDEGQWHFGFLSWYSDVLACICDGADYEVEPETVGQYTGLRDCTDREIYEGDGLYNGRDRFQVKYKSEWGAFVAYREGLRGEISEEDVVLLDKVVNSPVDRLKPMVVGNIHDNVFEQGGPK